MSQPQVQMWLGLKGVCGQTLGNYSIDPHLTSLTNMNDKGVSFKDIAAHVRKHPEAYFSEPK